MTDEAESDPSAHTGMAGTVSEAMSAAAQMTGLMRATLILRVFLLMEDPFRCMKEHFVKCSFLQVCSQLDFD
jgi:hypothetical protein